MNQLTFLKLGGSLITDKTRPYTARLDKLADLARQIVRAQQAAPELRLILGHGSGSFGHAAAKSLTTPLRHSPNSATLGDASQNLGREFWHGFAEVWYQASALNRLVMEALHAAGIAAVALEPVAAVTAEAGRVAHWDLGPLRSALGAGLTPVVYGDVVFDRARGGVILSTEDLFAHLARELHPQRILLAGLEAAVWADFPERTLRAERITLTSFADVQRGLGGSHGPDVTGGMKSKVRQMLDLVQGVPGLTVQIFSGEEAGNVSRTLSGEVLGSLISAE
jgi:isopentenyl phosphate kinase